VAEGKFIAYYRVSTAKQGASGLGLDAQRSAVETWLNGGDWSLLATFTEVETGKDAERPQLAAALNLCKLTGSTLVIAKLDRLSRNLAFLATLMDGAVDFVAADNPHATRFTLHILAAVAEHEAAMISQRTRAALQAARERGVKLGGYRGGPNPDGARSAAVRAAKACARATMLAPVLAELQSTGMSLNQIAAELIKRGIRTARSGAWTATGVRRELQRASVLPPLTTNAVAPSEGRERPCGREPRPQQP
jgi:DNA invertase Pin-like site-specific DNA recombinase